MYILIPQFIHDQAAAGHTHGSLLASTLFLDISGFTAMTELLMQRGKEGAERMAAIMNKVFEPVIELVYQHNGFITSFAGDAFTVVFPGNPQKTSQVACAVSVTIRHLFITNSHPDSVFGQFSLAVKQGVSSGDVEWGIIGSEKRKTFYFRGHAIIGCRQAEKSAGQNEIILDERLLDWLPASWIGQQRGESFHQLLTETMNVGTIAKRPLPVANIEPAIAAQFFPLSLWNQPYVGELRHITPLFIAIPQNLTHEDTHSFISHLLRIVDQFNGHFVEIYFESTIGLVLIYFGAPVTHEDDITRALQCVLTLKKSWENNSINWKAGITMGPVYAGYIGSPRRAKYTALGSVVNLAARLMEYADWGQILVSETVAQQTHFDFPFLNQLTLKGFAQPIPTHLLQAEKQNNPTFYSEPLLGRESELIALQQFTQKQSSGMMLIYGEPGMGKSHLVYSLRQQLPPKVIWFIGRVDPILRESFSPFIYWLKHYFRQSQQATDAVNKWQFEQKITELCNNEAILTIKSLAAQICQATSFLGALLGLYWPDSLYSQLDAQRRFQHTSQAIQALLLGESKRQPIIFLLEDFHWLDEASHKLITDLAETLGNQTANHPLLLLATARYTDDGKPPLLVHDVNLPQLTINLDQLSLAAVQQQATFILNGSITPKLRQLLYDKSTSNPFFVQQILYYCQENTLLHKENGLWDLNTTSFTIPTSIQAVLIARIDRLDQNVKLIVQAAAVLGCEFEPQILADILQQDINSAIQQAEKEQIWSVLPSLRHYIFNHELLRDAAYDMQLRTRLRELHKLAATVYERHYGAEKASLYASRIAHHYEQAGVTNKMAYWSSQAGQQAFQNYANEDALAHFQRALTTDSLNIPDQITLYCDLGEVLRRQSLYSEAILVYRSMLKMAASIADQASQAQAWIGLSWTYQIQGQDQASLDSATEAEALLQKFDRPALLVEALYHKGWALYRLGRISDAYNLAQQGLVVTREQELSHKEILLLNLLSVLEYYSLGQYETAVIHQEQALVIAQTNKDRHSEGFLTSNLGDNYLQQGDYARAKKHYQRAVTIAREIGDHDGKMVYLSNLSGAQIQLGEIETAVSRLNELIKTAPKNWYVLPDAYCFLAQGYMTQEKFSHAVDVLQKGWKVAEAPEQKGNIWLLYGQLAAQTKQPVILDSNIDTATSYDARQCFAASLKLFTAEKRRCDCALVWREWSRLEWAQGHHNRGKQLWKLARDCFIDLNLPLFVQEMDQTTFIR